MNGYASREVFPPEMQFLLEDATEFIRRVSRNWGNELRCHEVARAIQRALRHRKHELELIDGRLGAIEHSWLHIATMKRPAILDVYVPGRLPQVQLIDDHWAISRQYERGELRTDIREALVEKAYREMMYDRDEDEDDPGSTETSAR